MKTKTRKTVQAFSAAALAFAGFFLSPGDARGAGLQKIELQEAIAIALQKNHDYKIALRQQKAAEEKINQAWSQLYPALESEASMARQWAPHGFLSLSDGQYDLKLLQVKFGVNPGAFYESLLMSRKGYKAAVEEVRRTRNTIANNVIKAYFNILLAEDMIVLKNT